ncbi:MAG: glycyl-tRNA synthetase beta chain [Candidatus Saganbacteria bacterium]|uniref:Glycine--tRNA ligase beta subunit n=1 Tax=Candidatus Saganbacteria bacterium TaxID=2575572 RepID=A0A833NZL4_UNCSA|nr:MAG: glycyl-tRNA synthetase beta chain [Candidatus Saganbacteria bacterium]
MAENVLFEIGCEEIPARFMPGLITEIKSKAKDKLSSMNLDFSNIYSSGTCRRLVLYIEKLAGKQPDCTEEIQGPPAEIAFDQNNKPTPAAFGFAKKCGIKVEQLKIRTVSNRNYVYSQVKKKGLSSEKLLPQILKEIISSIYLPLAMRWGSNDFKFIRPIHWIVALHGSKIIKFELAGIKSSNITFGHRFIKNPKRHIKHADLNKYKEILKKANVLVDSDERRDKISKLIKKADYYAHLDKNLLEEVNYLVEFPIAQKGKFNPKYLSLPKEVLITSMKKNQKYFSVIDFSGKLLPKFILVSNNSKNVVRGNEKVISARLADAMFFFNKDRKIPLKSRVADLKKVEYFQGLGSMHDKVERLQKLSLYIAKHLKIAEIEHQKIINAAELSKADLTTEMVFEFPDLQGVMGREYALASGEDKDTAEAIFEHYLPRFAEDKLPAAMIGTVVSLADKIDTMAGCFLIGKIPSGSEDPFGLRRSAHGVIKIVLEKKIDLLLDEIFNYSLEVYGNKEPSNIVKQLIQFIAGRMKVLLVDEDIPSQVAEAALANFNDILEAKEITHVLNNNLKNDWFLGIAATQSRISKMVKDIKRDQVITADFIDQCEKDLYELYLKVNWNTAEKINSGDYNGALLELSALTQPIEEFFKKVMVMHEDERIKTNRLALLKTIEKLFFSYSDFTKLQV